MRIHFTGEDLARTAIAGQPDQLWEVLLSLHLMQSRQGEAVFGSWRLGGALTAYHRKAIAPYWPTIKTRIASDRALRVRQLAAGGVDQLLSNLHPRVQQAGILRDAGLITTWRTGVAVRHEATHLGIRLLEGVLPDALR